MEQISEAVLRDVTPRDSWRASKAFREHISKVLCKRALVEAVKRAEEADAPRDGECERIGGYESVGEYEDGGAYISDAGKSSVNETGIQNGANQYKLVR